MVPWVVRGIAFLTVRILMAFYRALLRSLMIHAAIPCMWTLMWQMDQNAVLAFALAICTEAPTQKRFLLTGHYLRMSCHQKQAAILYGDTLAFGVLAPNAMQ